MGLCGVSLKIFTRLKIRIHRSTVRQTQQTMVRKLNIDKGYSDTKEGRPAGNRTYNKSAVQWLNQALCFYSIVVLVDSFVLRNPPERQARKRYEK